MKITKLLTFAMAIGMLFSSCSENDFDGVNPPASEGGVGEVSVSLMDASGALTRSYGSDGGYASEKTINNLVFYIFDQDGTRDADFPTVVPTEAPGSSRFTFNVSAGTKTILVAINTGLGNIEGNLDVVKARLHEVAISTPSVAPEAAIAGGIPMTGEVSGVEVTNGDVKNARINVERLYARFNPPAAEDAAVEITLAEEVEELKEILGIEEIEGEIAFDYSAYIVVNGIKKSFLFPTYGENVDPIYDRWNPAVWTLGADTDNYTRSQYNESGDLGQVYSGGTFLTDNNVYLYENSPLYLTASQTGTISGYLKETIYAMILKGDLYDDANPDNKTTRYWRVNVHKTGNSDNYFQIVRNSIYKVNIQTIRTIGFGTPEEAEEEGGGGGGVIPGPDDASVEIMVNILDWKVFEEDQDM